MKQNFTKWLLSLLLVMVGVNAWGEDVTYTPSSTTAVSTSGTAPSGSSATFATTYTDKNQLTSGKTQTLTISGFDDCTITGVTLNMKKSSKGSTATIGVKVGDNTINTTTSATLTTTATDYPITVTSTTVPASKNIVITVKADASSAYVYSYKVTYSASDKTPTTTTFGNQVDNQTFVFTQGDANFTKTATLSPADAGSLTYSSTNSKIADVNASTGEVTIVAPGTATIKATFGGSDTYTMSSAEYNVKVNPKGTAVVFTETSTSAVSTEGTVPEGSSATFASTYGSKNQLTSPNTATLTLSGYAGCKINCIKLNMKSNSGSGAGTFSAVVGTGENATTIASISEATTFDKWYDNTEYSGSYKDILVTMDNTSRVINDGENVVLTVKCTTNSLFVNSFTVYYDVAQPAATIPNISPADGTEFSTPTKEVTITAADGATIYYTTDGTTPSNTSTQYTGAFNISATTTVKAIAYETDKRPSAVANATITYVAPVTNYDITCNAPVGGTYTVKVGNEEAQTITEAKTIQGGEGKTITLTSTASTGYKLHSTPFVVKDADDNKVDVSKSGDNYTFTMPSKAVTITAQYSAVYTISAAAGIANGTISFTDSNDKAITETSAGSKVNVVVTPATGYELATLTYLKDGDNVDIKENKYFSMPGANTTVTATFSKINYTITYADNLTGGEVSGVATANYGDEVALTATPSTGYAHTAWSVKNGENDIEVSAENKFTMPAANVNVSATFSQIATVTLSENGAETTLTGTYYVGDEVTLPSTTTAAVPTGKTFMGWSEATVTTTDTKPTYLEKGAKYTTTGATKKFYAVYATSKAGDPVYNVASSVTAGDVVVIASNKNYSDHDMKTAGAVSSSLLTTTASTFNDQKTQITTLANGTVEFTVGGNSTDGWTLMSGTNYLQMTGDKKMGISEASSTWSISISNYVATVSQKYTPSGKSEGTYKIQYNYNNGSDRFTGYTSSQVDISLYKKESSVEYVAYTTSAQPAVATPTFSIEAGTYDIAKSVELACTTDGATIYYTTDGEDPTAESNEYTTAINVAQDMTIKAKAFKDGMDASAVASASYVINLPFTTIASFKTAQPATDKKVIFTEESNVVITGVNNKNVYLQQGDDAIMLYCASATAPTWTVGKKLIGTMDASYDTFAGMPEMKAANYNNVYATVDGTLPTPVEITALTEENITSNIVKRVTLKGVNFYEESLTSQTVTLVDADMNELLMIDKFNVVADKTLPLADDAADVTGIMIGYSKSGTTNYELLLQNATDIVVDKVATLPALSVAGSTDAENPSAVASNSTVTVTPNGDFTSKLDGSTIASAQNITINKVDGTTSIAVTASRDFYTDASATYYFTTSDKYTSQSLSFAAYNKDGYWATFSNSNVTFIPYSVVTNTVAVSGTSLVMFDGEDAVFGDAVTINVGGNDVTGYYVPANTGVLVNIANNNEGAGTTATYYTVTNKSVGAIDATYNMLQPGANALTAGDDCKFYRLAYGDFSAKTGLGFYYGSGCQNGEAFKCKAGQAYLAVPNAAGARSFYAFDVEGETTGISELDATSVQNGKYIHNGRVVIVKNGQKFNAAGQIVK